MFDEEMFTFLALLKNAESVLALSGSPLMKVHNEFLEAVLPLSVVASFPDENIRNCESKGVFVCKSQFQ